MRAGQVIAAVQYALDTNQTVNSRGEWVPSIPLPFYLLVRKRCSCGATFWTTAGYEGHYALRHILEMEQTRPADHFGISVYGVTATEPLTWDRRPADHTGGREP